MILNLEDGYDKS
jgi:hypothetical protein